MQALISIVVLTYITENILCQCIFDVTTSKNYTIIKIIIQVYTYTHVTEGHHNRSRAFISTDHAHTVTLYYINTCLIVYKNIMTVGYKL